MSHISVSYMNNTMDDQLHVDFSHKIPRHTETFLALSRNNNSSLWDKKKHDFLFFCNCNRILKSVAIHAFLTRSPAIKRCRLTICDYLSPLTRGYPVCRFRLYLLFTILLRIETQGRARCGLQGRRTAKLLPKGGLEVGTIPKNKPVAPEQPPSDESFREERTWKTSSSSTSFLWFWANLPLLMLRSTRREQTEEEKKKSSK